MTPDDLRRALQGATPELREALAECLVQQVAPDAQVFDSAIETNQSYAPGVNGFDLAIGLALLTDAQRADAWHAARDRVATEQGEATPETDGGIPMTVWTLDTATVWTLDTATGEALPAPGFPAGSVGAIVSDLEQQVSDTRKRMLQAARRGGVQIVTRTFSNELETRTVYGYRDADGNEYWPGV